MTNFSPVTVLDTSTSMGLNDVPAYLLDYRFFEANSQVSFVGTIASAGAADFVDLYVSTDTTRKHGTGTFVRVSAYHTTSFADQTLGPWSAVKFVKRGDQAVRVIALMNGTDAMNKDQFQ